MPSARQRVSAAELTIITRLFLLGGGIFWLSDRASESPSSAAALLQPPGGEPGPSTLVSDKSIAVLPFVNMSGDPSEQAVQTTCPGGADARHGSYVEPAPDLNSRPHQPTPAA